jgi:hypothetical protein
MKLLHLSCLFLLLLLLNIITFVNSQEYGGGLAAMVNGKNNKRTGQFYIAGAGESLDSKVRVPLKQVLGRRTNVATTMYDSETGRYNLLSTKFVNGQRKHFLEIYDAWTGDELTIIELKWQIDMLEYDMRLRQFIGLATIIMPRPAGAKKPLLGHQIVKVELVVKDDGTQETIQEELRGIPADASPITGLSAIDSMNSRFFLVVRSSKNDAMEVSANGVFSHASNMMLFGIDHKRNNIVVYKALKERVSVFVFDNLRGLLWGVNAGTMRDDYAGRMVQLATSDKDGVRVTDNSLVTLTTDLDKDGNNDVLDPKLLYPSFFKNNLYSQMNLFDAMLDHQSKDFRLVMRERPHGPNTFATMEIASINQDTKVKSHPAIKDQDMMIPRNNGTMKPELGISVKWDIFNPDAHMKVIRETPPPKVRESRFAPSGAWFSVTFDIDTDLAEQSGSFLPSRLLEKESADLLGEGARCAWESPNRLIFFMGANARVQPSETKMNWRKVVVDMKGNVLNIPDNIAGVRGIDIVGGTILPSKRFLTGSFFPLGPKLIPLPVVVLQAPGSASMCDDVRIDGSMSYNHGGRPYYSWKIKSITGDGAVGARSEALYAYIDQVNNASYSSGVEGFSSVNILSIQKDLITPNSYFVFELSVMSFFGTIATKEHQIFISSLPIPTLWLVGAPEREWTGPRTLRLSGAGVLSKCISGNANIMWEWYLVSVTNATGHSIPSMRFPLDVRSSVTKTLVIAKNSMTLGYKYTFKAKGSLDTFPDVFSTITAVVNIVPSELIGVINGGNRLVGRAKEFSVDALRSFDPDEPDVSSEATMRFIWDCHVQGWPDIGCFANHGNSTNGTTFAFPAAATVNVPPYIFLPGFYTLVVRVMKDSRLTTTASNIEIVGGAPPNVFIDPLPKAKVLSTEIIRLKGRGLSNDPTFNNDNLNYEWKLHKGNLDLSVAALTGVNSPVFAIRSNVLSPGSIYTMRLTAKDFDGVGYGEIALIVATPPAGGSFAVAPTNGVALDTVFKLEASAQWTADDLPLTYDFSYQAIPPAELTSPLDEAKLTQNPISARTYETNMIPTGEGDGNLLRAVCYIISSVGASTRVVRDIVVIGMDSSDQGAAVGQMGSILTEQSDTGDPAEVMVAIQGIGSTLGAMAKEETRRRRRRRRLMGENVDDSGGMTEADCAGDQKCLDDLIARQVMRENLLGTMGSQDVAVTPEALDVKSKALKTMGGDGETSPEFNSEAMGMLDGMVAGSGSVGMSKGASGTSPMAGDVVGSVSGVIQSDSGEAEAEKALLIQGGRIKGDGGSRRLKRRKLREIRERRRRERHAMRKKLGLPIPEFVHRRLSRFLNADTGEDEEEELEITIDPQAKARAENVAGMMDNLGGQTIGEALPGEEPLGLDSPNLMIKNSRSFSADMKGNETASPAARRRRLHAQRRLSSSGGSDKGGFDLPGGMLNGVNGTGDSVDSAQAGYAKNPYAYSEATSAAEANTAVCGLKMKGAGGAKLDIDNLPAGSLIGVSCGVPNDMTVCSYWDKEINKGAGGWSTKGVINDGGICYTSHLTDFSPVGDTSGPQVNAVDPIADASKLSKLDTNNMGPLIILGVLWFIYLAGCISGAYMDGKQRKEWREEQRKERRASRKEIRDQMRQKRKLRAISKTNANPLDVEKNEDKKKNEEDGDRKDKSTNKAASLLSGKGGGKMSKWKIAQASVVVADEEKESGASAAWGAVLEQLSFGDHIDNVKDTIVDEFKEGHSLFSIWYVKPDDRYTRPQRLTVLMALILGQTALSALFFGLEEGADGEESEGQAMMVGMVCSIIMFPVEKVFASMFAQAKPPKKPDPEVIRRKNQRRILRVQQKYKDKTDKRGKRRKKAKAPKALAAPAPPKFGSSKKGGFVRRLHAGFRSGGRSGGNASRIMGGGPAPPPPPGSKNSPANGGRKILIRRSSVGAPPPPPNGNSGGGNKPPPPSGVAPNGSGARRMLRATVAPGEISRMRNQDTGGKAPPPPPPPGMNGSSGGGPSSASRLRSGFRLRQAAKKTLTSGSAFGLGKKVPPPPPSGGNDVAEQSKKDFRRKLLQGKPPAAVPPPVAPPIGKGIIKRKAFTRSHAAHMDLTKLQDMIKENPEMANEMLQNPSIPAQVKEQVRAMKIVNDAKVQNKKSSISARRALDRKMLRKKMKFRRRARLAKQFRRMKRRALRAARKLSRIVAYVGAILFILVATFFCLIYSVKFEPPVAMAWISASMLGTLQGWLLLEPFEIVVGATKGEWTDSMKDVYMEKLGGERYQAAMFKHNDMLIDDKEKK